MSYPYVQIVAMEMHQQVLGHQVLAERGKLRLTSRSGSWSREAGSSSHES